MSYETAKATRLLATNCLCCSRPLLDAQSVEAGIGPHCRKKYGYKKIDESVRKAANILIHEAARGECKRERRKEIAQELSSMGATEVADKIRSRFLGADLTMKFGAYRFGKGRYERISDGWSLTTPYSPSFNSDMKESVDWKHRSILKDEETGKFKAWTFDSGSASRSTSDLVDCLTRHFAGMTIQFVESGTVTEFVIPDSPSAGTKPLKETLRKGGKKHPHAPVAESPEPVVTLSRDELEVEVAVATTSPTTPTQLDFGDWARSLAL